MREFAVVDVESRFDIPHPPAARFVDMTGEALHRPGIDMDLSHWMPNLTPADLRADTSTEICLRFVERYPDDDGVAVNSHADTDGVLSLFALVERELALEHRDAIVAVAEMGDFSSTARATDVHAAATLYADLRSCISSCDPARAMRATFATCMTFFAELLRGDRSPTDDAVRRSDALRRSIDLAAERRMPLHDRITGFVVDAGDDTWARGFDAEIPDVIGLSPLARNRVDRERLHLLAAPSDAGWLHAVAVPQHVPWDTETLWRPPGWTFSGERLEWRHTGPGLAELAARGWDVIDVAAPWTAGFPIVARTRVPVADDPDGAFAALVDILSAELDQEVSA